MLAKLFDTIGCIAPKSTRSELTRTLTYAGMKQDTEEWIGISIVLSLLVALVAGAGVRLAGFSFAIALLAFLACFATVMSVRYLLVYFKVEERRQRVEDILPDLLQMISANIKAGVSPVVALRMAARPEFGPLEAEIKYVTTKSMGVESFTKALMELTNTIKSDMLARSVSLFATSLRSGGNINRILEANAEDIRAAHELKRLLLSGTNMYIVFIIFTTVIGMPALLSVSMQFVEMTAKLQAKTASSMALQIGIMTAKPVSPEFVFDLSLFTLVATSILASMFVGVIHEGKRLSGLRLAPFLIIGSLAFFFIMKNYVLRLLLGG